MKYQNFLTKLLCLILVAAALLKYQQIAEARTALVADHDTQAAEIEAYNAELLRSIQADTQDSAGKEAAVETIYADGIYTGTAAGFGGDITVSVSLEADQIIDISVLSAAGEDPAYLEQAESVLTEILTQQDTAVDTVSGATFSSGGLIEATRQALEKAVK
jgi:uncharacterized protein with FMN-binding domain